MKDLMKLFCISIVLAFSTMLSYSQQRIVSMPQSIRMMSYDGYFDNCVAVSREVFLAGFNHGEMRDTTITDAKEIGTIVTKLNRLKKQKSVPFGTDQILKELIYSKQMGGVVPMSKDGDNRMLMLLHTANGLQYVWFTMNGVYIGKGLYQWDDELGDLVSRYCNSFPQ